MTEEFVEGSVHQNGVAVITSITPKVFPSFFFFHCSLVSNIFLKIFFNLPFLCVTIISIHFFFNFTHFLFFLELCGFIDGFYFIMFFSCLIKCDDVIFFFGSFCQHFRVIDDGRKNINIQVNMYCFALQSILNLMIIVSYSFQRRIPSYFSYLVIIFGPYSFVKLFEV